MKSKSFNVTSNETEQIRLFKEVAKSWKINTASPESNDIGHYSFLVNNCGTWATTMVRKSGLTVPQVMLNFGTGTGGIMDKIGLPQATFKASEVIANTLEIPEKTSREIERKQNTFFEKIGILNDVDTWLAIFQIQGGY